MDTRRSGNLGENYARDLLKREGYKILTVNYRTKVGEIDIVAIDGTKKLADEDVLVFVEVKTRWSRKYGRAEEAVNIKKLRRIQMAGELFSLKNKDLPKKIRIDVVALEVQAGRISSAKIIPVI